MPLLYPSTDEDKRTLAKWASQRLNIGDYGNFTAIGVYHDAKIVAVALYHGYISPNIEITFVTSSPRWASPNAVKAIIQYPFKIGCNRITATTRAKNQSARTFLCRLGFKHEGTHPEVFSDDDAVSYGLLKKDASRWLGEEEVVQSTSANCS